MGPESDFIVQSVLGLRTGFTIYGYSVVGLAIVFLGRGQLPQQLSTMLRSTAFFWAGAYTFVLWDMLPTLPREDILLMGIFPSLCLFILPECVELLMQSLYLTFDWPTPLKKMAFEQQKKQLDLSFRSQTARSKTWRPQRQKDPFYQSPEWIRLRYKVLRSFGRRCAACGTQDPNQEYHVDHIKPRSRYPELALDFTNMQVLCRNCNLGKSNRYIDDWRSDDGKGKVQRGQWTE